MTIDERPNYCNDDFPILSFLYALYCDAEFSKREFDRWLKSFDGSGYPYTGYLDNYTKEKKGPFPPEAKNIISRQVAGNPAGKDGRRTPTRDQATTLGKYLLAELTATPGDKDPPSKPPLDRVPFDSSRPILSLLAMIFVQLDNRFQAIAGELGVTGPAREILDQTQWGKNGRPYLSPSQAGALMPMLVEELSGGPSPW